MREMMSEQIAGNNMGSGEHEVSTLLYFYDPELYSIMQGARATLRPTDPAPEVIMPRKFARPVATRSAAHETSRL